MSVRPTIAFVCGINDVEKNDPRYVQPPQFDLNHPILWVGVTRDMLKFMIVLYWS